MPHDCSFLRELSLADDQVSVAPADRDDYATDYGTTAADASAPDAVVYPESSEDVAAVLAAANERGVPVTPYAAGSGTEGHAVPVRGGVTLAMERMDRVLDVRPDDLQVDVQPGVVGDDLNEHVASHDLFFPAFPQSAAFSTVGGMIATDASGRRTVKYGEVREWVRELDVVTADGRTLTLGNRATKTSAGYNLRDLFVGSEGTLGVVTRATLELAVRPAETLGGRAVFPTLDDATAAVTDVRRAGVDVATLELVDALTADIANSYTGAGLPDAPTVFFELHGRALDAERDRLREIFERHDADRVDASADDEEMAELWAARRDVGRALQAYDENRVLQTAGDVTVPLGSYADVVRYIGAVGDEYDLPIPAFGHAGDGNAHYAVLVDPDDPDEVERGHEASADIVREAVRLGGTCTGEHGVGRGKRDYLADELADETLDAMRDVKDLFDPEGILNPGKVFR